MTILHKIGVYAVVAIVLTSAVALGYNHYQNLLSQLSVLEKDNTTLTLSLDVQAETVEQLEGAVMEWQLAAEEQRLRADRMQQAAQTARDESRRLNDIFARHDLTLLARAKPGLIERRINDGTDRVLALFTCETTTPGRCGSDGGGEADQADAAQP